MEVSDFLYCVEHMTLRVWIIIEPDDYLKKKHCCTRKRVAMDTNRAHADAGISDDQFS